MERILRDVKQLKVAQQEDLPLKPIRESLAKGEEETAYYVLDDQSLLWYAPRAIMEHLCRCLKVSLDFGPTNHARGLGTVERMGSVLQEMLLELCQARTDRWDEYVAVVTWAHRTLPDESLPNHESAYQLLFGRAPRTPFDQLPPSLDNSGPALPLERTMEETRRKTIEEVQALRMRQANNNRNRDIPNARIKRTSPGAKANVGD